MASVLWPSIKLIAVMAVLWSTASGAAVECGTSPTGPGPWRYRTVDGKSCWYRNDGAIPKSDLRWPTLAGGAENVAPDVPPKPVKVIPYRMATADDTGRRDQLIIGILAVAVALALTFVVLVSAAKQGEEGNET